MQDAAAATSSGLHVVAVTTTAAAGIMCGVFSCPALMVPSARRAQPLEPEPEPEPGPKPAPVSLVDPGAHSERLAPLSASQMTQESWLAGWQRVAVGSGQLRWVEDKKTPKKGTKAQPPGASSSGGGHLNDAISTTASRPKVNFSSLASVPAAADRLIAAQRMMDQAYSVCPVVPIHTTFQTSSASSGTDGHQKLVLRKAGKGECVSQRPQLAANAIALGQQALASLQEACELEPFLSTVPAVQKTLQVWRERLADFEDAKATPLPRPIAEFNEECRSEAVLPYCTATYRLREAMTAVVRMGWAEAPVGGETAPFALEKLHTLPTDRGIPGCPAVLYAFKQAGMPIPQSWTAFLKPGKRGRQKHIKEFRASRQYQAFLHEYRRFVADVILPLVDDRDMGVIFQCPPTLRVVFPSTRATGKPHRDSEYIGHEPSEINFWCPFVDVYSSNTLQTESQPGLGDFRPMVLSGKEFLRFNGSYCEHYTLPNQTPDTRVSFDFRVIPRSFWLDNYGRRIGDYDCELALPAVAS